MANIKAFVRKSPRLFKLVHRLGIRSQSDWLFTADVLRWITTPYYKEQLPWTFKIFASYCQFWSKINRRKRITSARYILKSLIHIQRMFDPPTSQYFKFPNIDMFLNLEDPRFIGVGNEIISGDISKLLSLFISEGDTFVDIGANQGAYSMLASKIVGQAGLIVSIEPLPQLAYNIEKSLALDPKCNFQVHQVAIGDYNGNVELIIPSSYSGTSGLFLEHSGLGWYRKLNTNIRCFDDLVDWEKFPGSVFLKLDVEGAELAFLKGAKTMLGNLRPNLLMEINPFSLSASNTNEKNLIDLLSNLGYVNYRNLEDLETFRELNTLNTNSYQNILLTGS